MHPAAAHAGKQCPRQLQRPVAAAGLQRARDERGCRAVVGLQRAGGLAQLGVKEQRLTGGERVAQRVLRLLRRGAQAVYSGIGAADADGGMHVRLLQLHAQLPGPGGGPGHELRGLVAAHDQHHVLVAEQAELRGRADLRHALAPGLDALRPRRRQCQRDGVQPPAEPGPGLAHRGRQLLRRVGLQKALEEMVLQHLVGHDRAAVEPLPVLPPRQLRRQILQQLVKFLRADRLEQIVVHVIADGLLRVGKLAEARQHDDDRLRKALVDELRQLQPVEKRHADIRDHHVRQNSLEMVGRLPAVFKDVRGREAEFFPIRVLRHRFAHERLVFHEHDLVHSAPLLCCL